MSKPSSIEEMLKERVLFMKNRKKKVLCTMMALSMFASISVKAVEKKAVVLYAQQGKNVSAELQIPSNQKEISTLKVSFEVEAKQGNVNDVKFQFDDKIESTIQEYRYQKDTGILTIYLSDGDGKNLFSEEKVSLGEFQFDSDKNAKITVSLKEDSFEYVNGTSSSQVFKESLEKESVEWTNMKNSSTEETTKQEQETTERATTKPSTSRPSSSKKHWTTGSPIQETTTQTETTTSEIKKNPETIPLIIETTSQAQSESTTAKIEPSREIETSTTSSSSSDVTQNPPENNKATTANRETFTASKDSLDIKDFLNVESSSNMETFSVLETSSNIESPSSEEELSEIEETANTEENQELESNLEKEQNVSQTYEKKENQILSLCVTIAVICGAVSLAVAWISRRYK